MGLSKAELRNIFFLLHSTPIKLSAIAKRYKVDEKVIQDINNGITYRSSTIYRCSSYPVRQIPLDLSFKSILKALRNTNDSYAEIGTKYKVDEDEVQAIDTAATFYRPLLKYYGITEYPVRSVYNHMPKDIAKSLITDLASGRLSIAQLSKKYKTSSVLIKRVNYGYLRKEVAKSLGVTSFPIRCDLMWKNRYKYELLYKLLQTTQLSLEELQEQTNLSQLEIIKFNNGVPTKVFSLESFPNSIPYIYSLPLNTFPIRSDLVVNDYIKDVKAFEIFELYLKIVSSLVDMLRNTNLTYGVMADKIYKDFGAVITASTILRLNFGIAGELFLEKLGINTFPIGDPTMHDDTTARVTDLALYKQIVDSLKNSTDSLHDIASSTGTTYSFVSSLNSGCVNQSHKLQLEKLGVVEFPIRKFKTLSTSNVVDDSKIEILTESKRKKVLSLLSSTDMSYAAISKACNASVYDIERLDNIAKVLGDNTNNVSISTVPEKPVIKVPKKTTHVLTLQEVREIVQLLFYTKEAQYKIAYRYGVSSHIISEINKGLKYKDELSALNIKYFPIRDTTMRRHN